MSEANDRRPVPPPGPPGPAGGAPRATRLRPPASDVNIRGLVLATLGLLAAMAIAWLAATWVINLMTYLTPQVLMPRQELMAEFDPEEDVQARLDFQSTERQTLSEYSWFNREQGVVRIPITRAMELTVQRGLPTRPENERPQTSDPGPGSSADSRSGRPLPTPSQ
jgi:hypothetical protein